MTAGFYRYTTSGKKNHECPQCHGKKLVPVYYLSGKMGSAPCPYCYGRGILLVKMDMEDYV